MAEQFSKTVASLLTNAAPKLDIPSSPTPPTTPKQPTTSAPPSPHPISNGTRNIIPMTHPNTNTGNDANVSGKILIFSIAANAFTYRTLTAGTSLKSVVLTSSSLRVCSMRIPMFATKVDLSEVGVKVGEGQVDGLVKELPAKAVLMRVLGWYRVLYVVRTVQGLEQGEDVEGVKDAGCGDHGEGMEDVKDRVVDGVKSVEGANEVDMVMDTKDVELAEGGK